MRPRGREKLESPGLEQAPPARFCLFPLRSCCARPALICDQRAAGAIVGCRNPVWRLAIDLMERATEGFSSRRSLLVSALTNYRYPPRLISALTTPPWQRTAQLDARACIARPWGKAGNERRKACFHPGGSGFLLPRGGQGHSQFYSIDFHVTSRFFVSFLTQERNVPPSSPSSPSFLPP